MGAPFLAKQPRWAEASIPSASPLRTCQPASARARSSPSAKTRPWSEVERVPTTGIDVRAFKCVSSDRSPSKYSLAVGDSSSFKQQGQEWSPGKRAQAGTKDSAQSRARPCNAQRLANRSTAKPAPCQGVPSANTRSDLVRWLDRGKACADPPRVSCPSLGNRSKATTTPAPALSKYICTSTASDLQGSIQKSWLTS